MHRGSGQAAVSHREGEGSSIVILYILGGERIGNQASPSVYRVEGEGEGQRASVTCIGILA